MARAPLASFLVAFPHNLLQGGLKMSQVTWEEFFESFSIREKSRIGIQYLSIAVLPQKKHHITRGCGHGNTTVENTTVESIKITSCHCWVDFTLLAQSSSSFHNGQTRKRHNTLLKKNNKNYHRMVTQMLGSCRGLTSVNKAAGQGPFEMSHRTCQCAIGLACKVECIGHSKWGIGWNLSVFVQPR